ncbi:hypothetical protein EVAR_11029_1 [Eumeta japonica]|uniref:Uncharacterized protein n=1 Tax=Eumeta variegata TaxID=151549 RepID=A0A4C1U413_EUMVA|nr:hypothetical protein EVAR_11029_1 [Eumeta japonica]
MLPRTKRKGAEMDLATREANELFLKGKEALSAGNEARVQSVAASACNHFTRSCLALSDSRSRHKYNLEAERTKHAQELNQNNSKNETSRTPETSNKTPRNKNLPKQLSANEEQLKAVQSAVQNVSERLNSARIQSCKSICMSNCGYKKWRQMSSAMKTMRDKRAQTPLATKRRTPAHWRKDREEGTQPTTVPPSTRTKPKCP